MVNCTFLHPAPATNQRQLDARASSSSTNHNLGMSLRILQPTSNARESNIPIIRRTVRSPQSRCVRAHSFVRSFIVLRAACCLVSTYALALILILIHSSVALRDGQIYLFFCPPCVRVCVSFRVLVPECKCVCVCAVWLNCHSTKARRKAQSLNRAIVHRVKSYLHTPLQSYRTIIKTNSHTCAICVCLCLLAQSLYCPGKQRIACEYIFGGSLARMCMRIRSTNKAHTLTHARCVAHVCARSVRARRRRRLEMADIINQRVPQLAVIFGPRKNPRTTVRGCLNILQLLSVITHVAYLCADPGVQFARQRGSIVFIVSLSNARVRCKAELSPSQFASLSAMSGRCVDGLLYFSTTAPSRRVFTHTHAAQQQLQRWLRPPTWWSDACRCISPSHFERFSRTHTRHKRTNRWRLHRLALARRLRRVLETCGVRTHRAPGATATRTRSNASNACVSFRRLFSRRVLAVRSVCLRFTRRTQLTHVCSLCVIEIKPLSHTTSLDVITL